MAEVDLCDNCEEHAATISCRLCEMLLCEEGGCNKNFHRPKKKKNHLRLPIGEDPITLLKKKRDQLTDHQNSHASTGNVPDVLLKAVMENGTCNNYASSRIKGSELIKLYEYKLGQGFVYVYKNDSKKLKLREDLVLKLTNLTMADHEEVEERTVKIPVPASAPKADATSDAAATGDVSGEAAGDATASDTAGATTNDDAGNAATADVEKKNDTDSKADEGKDDGDGVDASTITDAKDADGAVEAGAKEEAASGADTSGANQDEVVDTAGEAKAASADGDTKAGAGADTDAKADATDAEGNADASTVEEKAEPVTVKDEKGKERIEEDDDDEEEEEDVTEVLPNFDGVEDIDLESLLKAKSRAKKIERGEKVDDKADEPIKQEVVKLRVDIPPGSSDCIQFLRINPKHKCRCEIKQIFSVTAGRPGLPSIAPLPDLRGISVEEIREWTIKEGEWELYDDVHDDGDRIVKYSWKHNDGYGILIQNHTPNMTLNEKLSFNLRNLLPEAYYPNSCNIKITETKKAVSKAEEMKRLLGDKKQKKAVPVNSGDNDGDAKMQQQSIETAKDDSSVTVIESRIVVNVLPQTEFFLLLKRMDAKRGFSMTVETDSFVRKKRR